MPEKLSVKGLTFGSPEYVRIAKHGEKLGRMTDALDDLSETATEVSELFPYMSSKEIRRLDHILAEIY